MLCTTRPWSSVQSNLPKVCWNNRYYTLTSGKIRAFVSGLAAAAATPSATHAHRGGGGRSRCRLGGGHARSIRCATCCSRRRNTVFTQIRLPSSRRRVSRATHPSSIHLPDNNVAACSTYDRTRFRRHRRRVVSRPNTHFRYSREHGRAGKQENTRKPAARQCTCTHHNETATGGCTRTPSTSLKTYVAAGGVITEMKLCCTRKTTNPASSEQFISAVKCVLEASATTRTELFYCTSGVISVLTRHAIRRHIHCDRDSEELGAPNLSPILMIWYFSIYTEIFR